MWIRLTSFLIVYLCSELNASMPMSPNLWSSSAAYFLRRRADLQLGLEPYRRSERSLKGLHRNVQCELNVHCSLYTNHTPHAWRPQVAVALPTTGAPSTGSRVRFKNWDINSLSRQLFAALHLHAIALFWARVLAVVDLPSAFRLPLLN